MPIIPDGDPCPCGNRGCLERYVSLEAFERWTSTMSEDDWVAEVAPILRSAIVTIENFFDPETIIIGGLAPKALQEKLAAATAPLPNSVAARANRNAERLMLSAAGHDAVLRGAAALAVSGTLSPRFGLMFKPEVARRADDPIMRKPNKAHAA
jgi:predicted NBD/HSP70 family sugar kinase